MENEMISSKRFFESHHITLSDYWLESCIQWYREENPNSNYTMETLHLKVYAQWLLLDLRDVEVPILPPNLAQHKKVVLNDIYALQMMYVTDISRPKFWQLQKLRNSSILANAAVDQENQNQNSNSGRRVLQLVLTDGVQEIEAIEYRPISALNVNLAPGVKIRIIGPVTLRRGQILLEEKNVSVLGGEVEELLVANAAENILARSLNLPENPNPNTIEETFIPVNDSVPQNNRNQQISANILYQRNNVQTTAVRNISDQSVNNNTTNSKVSVQDGSTLKQQNLPISNEVDLDIVMDDDDELRIMTEVDMLLETERDIEQESKRLQTNSPDMFEDVDINNMSNIEKNANISNSTPKKEDSEVSHSKNAETNNSIFEDIDIDAHLDLVDEQIKRVNQNKKIQKGAVAIDHLLRNRSSISSGKFTVKAKFKSVTQKITVTDEAWSLKLLIGDATGNLEVHVHSEVISNLAGYCPSAMMALKKDIVGKDKCATATVMKIIEELKSKIMKLDCLMDIMFTPNEKCPTIILLK